MDVLLSHSDQKIQEAFFYRYMDTKRDARHAFVKLSPQILAQSSLILSFQQSTLEYLSKKSMWIHAFRLFYLVALYGVCLCIGPSSVEQKLLAERELPHHLLRWKYMHLTRR